MSLTQERLREVLNYDQSTGVFSWKIAPSNSVKPGQVAGSPDGKGYTSIGIDGRKFQASRLAFLWMTGSWPANDAEHEDGNPENNRWENLRDATVSQNMQNKRIQSNNRVGLKGVVLHKPGIWRARIKAGKQIHLGTFNCPAAAHLVYVTAAHRLFGEFARAG